MLVYISVSVCVHKQPVHVCAYNAHFRDFGLNCVSNEAMSLFMGYLGACTINSSIMIRCSGRGTNLNNFLKIFL